MEDEYVSSRLWPFFTIRVMRRRRPDFAAYVAALGLGRDPSDLDVLGRSGGDRKGDTVQVVEEPTTSGNGSSESIFLARGVRYAAQRHGTVDDLARIRDGAQLLLRDDHGNPKNPRAVLLTTANEAPVGWVPDVLVDYVDSLLANGPAEIVALRNNGTGLPMHLRLLVRVRGHLEAGARPFDSVFARLHRSM